MSARGYVYRTCTVASYSIICVSLDIVVCGVTLLDSEGANVLVVTTKIGLSWTLFQRLFAILQCADSPPPW